MPHSPEHHIEHAEHAAHATRDPFDRNVTMTIAIVAAILACVTMLGHRAHTETLRLQGEAISLQTEASILHTRTTNKWAQYQAVNIRDHEYRAYLKLLAVMSPRPDTASVEKEAQAEWQGQVSKYKKTLPGLMDEARELEERTKKKQEEAQQRLHDSHLAHARADRFDYGELGVELGLVLCSLAVLTKRRGFWYSGIATTLAGVLVAGSGLLGLFMNAHH
jgi:uncharacterized membrane protein YcjF (UPF0283 family)